MKIKRNSVGLYSQSWIVRIWLGEQKRLESSAESGQRRYRRNLRWQAVPHLSASNRKCSAANSAAVNRRLDKTVAAGRAKTPATWKVGNVGERAKVRRCTALKTIANRSKTPNGSGYSGRLVIQRSRVRISPTALRPPEKLSSKTPHSWQTIARYITGHLADCNFATWILYKNVVYRQSLWLADMWYAYWAAGSEPSRRQISKLRRRSCD